MTSVTKRTFFGPSYERFPKDPSKIQYDRTKNIITRVTRVTYS
jgi:hypothetical protein